MVFFPTAWFLLAAREKPVLNPPTHQRGKKQLQQMRFFIIFVFSLLCLFSAPLLSKATQSNVQFFFICFISFGVFCLIEFFIGVIVRRDTAATTMCCCGKCVRARAVVVAGDELES